jgi:hypothetical protein
MNAINKPLNISHGLMATLAWGTPAVLTSLNVYRSSFIPYTLTFTPYPLTFTVYPPPPPQLTRHRGRCPNLALNPCKTAAFARKYAFLLKRNIQSTGHDSSIEKAWTALHFSPPSGAKQGGNASITRRQPNSAAARAERRWREIETNTDMRYAHYCVQTRKVFHKHSRWLREPPRKRRYMRGFAYNAVIRRCIANLLDKLCKNGK